MERNDDKKEEVDDEWVACDNGQVGVFHEDYEYGRRDYSVHDVEEDTCHGTDDHHEACGGLHIVHHRVRCHDEDGGDESEQDCA